MSSAYIRVEGSSSSYSEASRMESLESRLRVNCSMACRSSIQDLTEYYPLSFPKRFNIRDIRKLDLHHIIKISLNSVSDQISSNFAARTPQPSSEGLTLSQYPNHSSVFSGTVLPWKLDPVRAIHAGSSAVLTPILFDSPMMIISNSSSHFLKCFSRLLLTAFSSLSALAEPRKESVKRTASLYRRKSIPSGMIITSRSHVTPVLRRTSGRTSIRSFMSTTIPAITWYCGDEIDLRSGHSILKLGKDPVTLYVLFPDILLLDLDHLQKSCIPLLHWKRIAIPVSALSQYHCFIKGYSRSSGLGESCCNSSVYCFFKG